jgi:hypothetical protein
MRNPPARRTAAVLWCAIGVTLCLSAGRPQSTAQTGLSPPGSSQARGAPATGQSLPSPKASQTAPAAPP